MAEVTIGIWGGTGSGKTTYLGALQVAAMLDSAGHWLIVGQDTIQSGSTAFLTSSMDRMLMAHEFPPASVAANQYCYRVTGRPQGDMLTQIRDTLFSKPSTVDFTLKFEDLPGRQFLILDHSDPLWAYLAGCVGLVYIYDPLVDGYTNYRYLAGALSFVYQEVDRQGRLFHNRLPHYIAICLSKYDDASVYEKLKVQGLIRCEVRRGVELPLVTDAQKAFQLFAHPLTTSTLENYFVQNRISYFATSSIGFYTQPGGKHDPSDYQNIVRTASGLRIRSEAVPINVFPPLIWLAGRAAKRS